MLTYDNKGFDIQFNYNFNMSGNYSRSQIDSVDYRPIIFTDNIKMGIISLFCLFEGNPKLELFVLFISNNYIKIGRNGIWHIKDNKIHLINDDFLPIIQYGRKGIIKINGSNFA